MSPLTVSFIRMCFSRSIERRARASSTEGEMETKISRGRTGETRQTSSNLASQALSHPRNRAREAAAAAKRPSSENGGCPSVLSARRGNTKKIQFTRVKGTRSYCTAAAAAATAAAAVGASSSATVPADELCAW